MLKIWGRLNSINVEKVVWTASELDLSFEHVEAGGKFGVVDTPAFKALNPCGKVPVIEDDGFVLWESNAIVRYLGAKYGSGTLLPADVAAQAQVDQWMDYQLSGVSPLLSPVFRGLVRTSPESRDNDEIARAYDGLAKALAIVDGALADGRYLVGDQFTVADIPLGCVVHRWFNMPVETAALERPDFGRLAAWYERLKKRPAASRILATPLT